MTTQYFDSCFKGTKQMVKVLFFIGREFPLGILIIHFDLYFPISCSTNGKLKTSV